MAEREIEIAVAVDIGELGPSRREREARELVGDVGEETVAVVLEQDRKTVEVVGQDHVPVTVAVDVAELDAPVPAEHRNPGIGLVAEESSAVIDVELRTQRGARRGIALAVGEGDVEIAVVVDIAERQLIGVDRLTRKSSRGAIGELLPERTPRDQHPDEYGGNGDSGWRHRELRRFEGGQTQTR